MLTFYSWLYQTCFKVEISQVLVHFEDTRIPDVDKPLIIAAMQDMGNVGSIVVTISTKV